MAEGTEAKPELRTRNIGIRQVRVADIEDAEWNFRTHPQAQQDALEGAIEELGGEHSLCVPARLDAGVKGGIVNASPAGPLRDRKAFPLVVDEHVLPRVARLFCASCPATVAWFVVAVVVLAVYLSPWWSLAHVGKEITKPVYTCPSIANSDSSSAVILESLVLRVEASIFNMSPYSVFIGQLPAPCRPVSCLFSDEALAVDAPATSRCPFDDVLLGNILFAAAGTLTVPPPSTLYSQGGDWCQSCECAARDVFRRAEVAVTLNGRHDAVLLNRTVLWIEPTSGDTLARLASL